MKNKNAYSHVYVFSTHNPSLLLYLIYYTNLVPTVLHLCSARMDALGVEAQWAVNEGNNIEASDKTLEMICALARQDSRAICALDFREVRMFFKAQIFSY